jgi:hypothetical protein
MEKKLTEKLEGFSQMLNSLNDDGKKLIFNIRSISKLNRLKEKLNKLSFLKEKNGKAENETRVRTKCDLDKIDQKKFVAGEMARFRKDKDDFKKTLKSSLRSIMVTSG